MSYENLVKWGRRDINLKIPAEFSSNQSLDQEKIEKTFPFTCVKWFNMLPVHIRNTFLTPRFDVLVTSYLKTFCYHRLGSGEYSGCSHCQSTARKTQFDADKIIELMKKYFEHEEEFSKITMDYDGLDAFLAVADLKLLYGDWLWDEIIAGRRGGFKMKKNKIS